MSRLSKEIFTKIPLTSIILPYYSKPNIWHNLMVRLRKDSWELWRNNYKKWMYILSEFMEKIRLLRFNILQPIFQISKHLFYKYTYRVKAFTQEIQKLTTILRHWKPFIIESVCIEFPRIDDRNQSESDNDLEIVLKKDNDIQLQEFIDSLNSLWRILNRHK